MKIHTSGFKEAISTNGREIDALVTYISEDSFYILTTESDEILQTEAAEDLVTQKGPVVYDRDNLFSVKPYFSTGLLKTVMKAVEINLTNPIDKGTQISVKFGVKVSGVYEYIDFGYYYVAEDPVFNADTLSYTIIAYDKMLESMKFYDEDKLNISYPISVKNYILEICDKLGWTFSTATFPNDGTLINSDLYFGLGKTYRDILDDLSEIIAGNLMINLSEELIVKTPTETSDTIDDEFIKDVGVNFGNKYGPVNTLVLSRAEDSDSIFRDNESSIDNNGLTELKIRDNILLDSEDREDFIDEMFTELDGLEYYLYDIASTGIGYYDPLDRFTINHDSVDYSVVLLNDEFIITQGLEENLYVEEPEETTTDYSTSAPSDKSIKNAVIIANKNAGQIILKANDAGALVLVELKADASTGSEFNVKADSINFESYDFNLTSDNITITSTNFSVTEAGVITAKAGTIADWNITTGLLYSGSGATRVGMSTGTYAFYAGNDTASSAPFSVTNAGALKATSGVVGGFTLGSTSLTASQVGIGTGTYAFWAGSDTASAAEFRVTNAGAVVASNMTITGGSLTIGSGSSMFQANSSGKLLSRNSTGFLTSGPGSASTHPYVSALNVATQGSSLGGISFRSGTVYTSVGSELGRIAVDSAGNMTVIADNNIIVKPQNDTYGVTFQIIGSTETSLNTTFRALCLQNGITKNVSSTGNGKAFYDDEGDGIDPTSTSNEIETVGGTSGKAWKKDIKILNNKDQNELAKLFVDMPISSFKYKYGKKKEESKIGFILEDVRNIDNKLIDFFPILSETRYDTGERLLINSENKEDKKVEALYYDKTDLLALAIASLAVAHKKIEKLEKLEARINGLEKEGD